MASLQVKHVPEATLATLRRRAAARHQSLQEFMLEKLIADANEPTWSEVFAAVDVEPGAPITGASMARTIREERDARG